MNQHYFFCFYFFSSETESEFSVEERYRKNLITLGIA